MRSGAAVSGSPGSGSISRQRRSGAAGASALQCGVGERGEREAEGRQRELVAVGRTARAMRVVELGAGAQQQQVALEGRQAEGEHDALERVGVGDRPRRRVGLAGERRLQPRRDAVELGGERQLVLGDPVAHSATVGSA